MIGRWKLVLQAEAGECALACLAMVSAFHGRVEGLSALRRRFPIGLTGTDLASLVKIASSVGFVARPVRCELDELGRLSTPAILHWDMTHFVVLKSYGRRSLTILDPARGLRVLTLEEVSKRFTGVALELTPSPTFQPIKTIVKPRLSDLWSRVTGLKTVLAQLFGLTLVVQLFGLLMPVANQLVVDDAIGHGDTQLLVGVIAAFSCLSLVMVGGDLLRGYLQLFAGQRLSLQLSGNVLRHLLRLPASFFETRHIGDIQSRFASLHAVQSFLTSGVVGAALDGMLLIPCAVIMILYSPILSVIVVLELVVAALVQVLLFDKNRRLNDEAISTGARMDSIFLETVRAFRTIKMSAGEDERHAVWQNATVDHQNVTFRQAILTQFGSAGFGLLTTLQGLLLLLVGALQVIDGRLTLGMLVAFAAYAGQFSARAKSLMGYAFQFKMLGLHLERIADIVQSEQETALDIASAHRRPLLGELEFRQLAFRYSTADRWILRDCCLAIRPGERVAIVGPSGGGKSTLLKILAGLYQPTEGELLVDGRPLSSVGLRNYRAQLGVVMQDDQLLSGTVADNIASFSQLIDMEWVEQVCRQAHVHDDICAMPMGYNSLIGEMGSVLSGGQKQRILLARALYTRPRCLFMDEGTANLDPIVEDAVLASLSRLDITQIMVAHRPAVVDYADRLVRVANGIIELGEAKQNGRRHHVPV